MHEVSIAESLIALIRRYVPAHQRLLRATVRIGPMHGLEPEAMQLAWTIATSEIGWSGANLNIELPPWRLRCTACGRCWEPAKVDEACVCGCTNVEIMGGDEFQLDSIEVDTPTAPSRNKSATANLARLHGVENGACHEHQSSNY
ncbi:MAG: hydrogenase maturation nickel metallochaperone HypA [Phycisphaerae bacterium]